ncbi:3'-5' exonuclease [Natranaerobius thermophilus]|uniref:DNA 3'-5' helicase n=1 Tax=Natranaerobius thermophilus (strain ATCC BAA-1301 / DSM 18059 / JW/NM-WN-LF) TaxID=457570 RepID=B2A7J4_NATTJ|nr:3'-5' exonuclease [Natranaerobius thermophilus]ACB85703.1 DNA polymerase III, epsilon subunit [Natranaerobius thermophilus JW/NM-WN-LF]
MISHLNYHVEELFRKLNDSQKQAVNQIEGSLLVTAPVGTGKTSVISLRAANAIVNGFDPNKILCLTFTNRAAREMKERIIQDLGPRAQNTTIKTFHALCAEIIRIESDILGIPADFNIFDEEDAKTILNDVIKTKDFQIASTDAKRFINFMMNYIARVKAANVDVEKINVNNPLGEQDKMDQLFRERLSEAYFKNTSKDQDFKHKEIFREYNRLLSENHALDFSDLIFYVDRLFSERTDAKTRWQDKFEFVQVDEVQDTSYQEYGIISELSQKHKNLSLFGDIQQTVYEWRGSAPNQVMENFKSEFSPVTEINLNVNYRSTRNILRACYCVASKYKGDSLDIWPEAQVEGEKTGIIKGAHRQQEVELIADQIFRLVREQGFKFQDIALLTRTNQVNHLISQELAKNQIPHFTVDSYKFFRRSEIKDAMAYLRLLFNKHDSNSLRRILQKPARGIGEKTIETLLNIPSDVGLKLVDFANTSTLKYRDPFARLVNKFEQNKLVVFDVETTGLDTTKDEIIELAALKAGKDGVVDEFHEYLRNSKPVGESFQVHGISDQVLLEQGKPPEKSLASFTNFIDDCDLVGHNVNYDITMVENQCKKLLNQDLELHGYDTVDISRRYFPRLEKYNLESLCEDLQISSKPTHRAMDDVEATFELLQILLEKIKPGIEKRKEYVNSYGDKFANLAIALNSWRRKTLTMRPPELLSHVIQESGLADYWKKDKQRINNLKELVSIFDYFDDETLSPNMSLKNILEYVSLGSDSDRHVLDQDKVALLTVHQAKGLEFDAVFIASADDNNFPYFRNKKLGNIDEEHRLFYVAMTRAKQALFISWASKDEHSFNQAISRFAKLIPKKYLNFIKSDYDKH